MRNFISKLILLALVACAGQPAFAGVVFDNGVPDLQGAFMSDISPYPNPNPNLPEGEVSADNFRLATPTVVNAVRFWGLYSLEGPVPPVPDTFVLGFFNNVEIIPGINLPESVANELPIVRDPISVSRTLTNMLLTVFDPNIGDFVNFPIFEYYAIFPDLLIPANEIKWLSIVNVTDQDDPNWFWATSDPNAGLSGVAFTSAFSQDQGIIWFGDFNNLAFQLESIPEPQAWLVWGGLGAIGLMAATRAPRRR